MPHNNCQLWFHIIWTTKNRDAVFTRDLLIHRLGPLLNEIAHEKGIDLQFTNGYKEHIHCLVKLSSTQNIATVVKNLKAISAKRINDQKWFDFIFSWQVGYSAFSVSPNRVPVAINYIKNQWEKHQKMDFSTEIQNMS
ncbi:IS200/IS605 family transposase [Flammeovirga sp. OC4]|uniref:IS200/IS605 family transposase n=1 Tax=Flammeovirga sp. OC4 TaxID=1382345 RepID=UPI0005C5BCB1|nr:IS200/IS605 family transposase [Flammeovirga sp. OC4]